MNQQEASPESTTKIFAPVAEYVSAQEPAPPAVAWPIPDSWYEDFIDTGTIVTFTAVVPLETLVRGGAGGLADYCKKAFDEDVSISDMEYRVLAQEKEDDFGQKFSGDVSLQVSCILHSE